MDVLPIIFHRVAAPLPPSDPAQLGFILMAKFGSEGEGEEGEHTREVRRRSRHSERWLEPPVAAASRGEKGVAAGRRRRRADRKSVCRERVSLLV